MKVEVQLSILENIVEQNKETSLNCDVKEFKSKRTKQNKRTQQPDDETNSSDISSSSEEWSKPRKPRTKRPDICNNYTYDSSCNKYRCDHCIVECKTKTNIRRHLHVVHHSTSSFRSMAGNELKSTTRRFIALKPPSSYKCPECPEVTCTSTLNLNTHMLTHYPEIECNTALTCSKCFKTCATSKKLYFHLINHNEAYLECDECGKKFKFKARLKRHLFMHLKHKRGSDPTEFKRSSSTPKRVMCDQCSQMVLNPRLHNFIHHSNERPFKCDEPGCKSAFKLSRALQEHKNLHSGEKPYVCEFCSHAFAHSAMLRMHRQR